MLEACSLTCVRGERVLFHALDLAAEPSSLLHVAGPNGSGKTSLLRILCGLLPPVEGEVCWQGAAISTLREDYRRQLLYIGHLNGLKDELTAVENLAIGCAIAGMPASGNDIECALDLLGLAGCETLPVKLLSQGQRRRAALARLALARSLPLWILDEPFSALDAGAADAVEHMIEAQLAGGGIVVLTTHQPLHALAARARRLELPGAD